jgi:hypothetical protein
MDIRGLANRAVQTVNRDVTVTVYRSTGYTIGVGAKQAPTYDAGTTGPAQVQSMSASDLKQLEGISQQGDYRSIYLRGTLHGIVRPDGKGGDKIAIGGETWLVVQVLESWPTWSKAAICLQ